MGNFEIVAQIKNIFFSFQLTSHFISQNFLELKKVKQ